MSENSALPLDSDSKPWSVILKRGSRGVYSILKEYSQTPKSVCRWNQLFAKLNCGEIFCEPILTTKDTQLRWFQFRILHRLLPTGRYLYLRHLTETPMCDFCSHKEETLLHLFWECPAVQSFWSDVMISKLELCGTVEHTSGTEYASDSVWPWPKCTNWWKVWPNYFDGKIPYFQQNCKRENQMLTFSSTH